MPNNAKALRPFSVHTKAYPAAPTAQAVVNAWQSMASHEELPIWRPGSQELWWKGRLVRRFLHDAENQTAVLAAFQAAGWPGRIDNPLPRAAGRGGKACRRETVRRLNRGLPPRTIRFRCDGVGGVRWEEVA